MIKALLLFCVLLSASVSGQIVLADTNLVCSGSAVRLFINPTMFNDLDFSVERLAERDGLFYFRSTQRLSFDDAVAYARLMKGNLSTLNTEEKNRFVSNLLPNIIKWVGYYQDPNSEFFNDAPDAASGFVWMSGADNGYTLWAFEEPDNREDTNPGMHVIQGCSNSNLAAWCDIDKDDGHKYIAIIETPFDEIPVIPDVRVVWETGEQSRFITVNPTESRYYKASIFVDDYEIQDSVLVSIVEAEANFTRPGGCGDPFFWTPNISTKVPKNDLEIAWSFGTSTQDDELSPELTYDQDGPTIAGVIIKSKSCGSVLKDTSTTYDLKYPFEAAEPTYYEAKLNEIVELVPKNSSKNFTYNWSPPEGLSSQDAENPTFTALVPRTYIVSINDGFDCITEEVFEFTIDPRIKVYIPEAFSPNGDGKNDTLSILTSTGFYGQFRNLIIQNRWGTVMYQSNSNWTWDGSYLGRKVPVGRYPYQLNYEIENVPYVKRGFLWVLSE